MEPVDNSKKHLKHRPLPNLENIDLRAMRIFLAVVRNKGFSAAETELNVNQPTISLQIGHLETRFGVKLCERGRGGFRLTDEGETIYEATNDLFSAIEGFRAVVGKSRGQLVGDLHLGIVDAVATNPDFKLSKLVHDFNQFADEVRIQIHVESPQALLKHLIQERIHVAFAPFSKLPSSLSKIPLFKEKQVLYCGNSHEFFDLDDEQITMDMLSTTKYAARSYLHDWRPPQSPHLKISAETGDMEALVLFIQSGSFIAYLPEHYASTWVSRNEMKPLFYNDLSYDSEFICSHRMGETHSPTIEFIKNITSAYQATGKSDS